MRIILKEKQFNIIKKIISEAGPNIDNQTKQRLGQSLMDMYKQFAVNKFIEFKLRSGTIIVLKCIKASKNQFEFEIIKDDKGAMKGWDKLTININPGKKGETDTFKQYSLNQKIIKPSSGKDGFTITFTGINSSGKNGEVNFNDITKVNQTSQPTNATNQSQDQSQNQGQDQEQNKEIINRILSDPNLKDAFYKAPTFWQMLKSELTGEEPKGKGILRALQIIDKYDLRNFQNDFVSHLIPNKKIRIKIIDPFSIKNSNNESVSFEKDEKIYVYYKNYKTDKAPVLSGEKNGIRFSIQLNVKDKIDDQIYKTKTDTGVYRFQILTDESDGWQEIETKEN